MDAIHTLLVVLGVQLGLAAVGWWLSAVHLGLPRAPALHWAAFCLCLMVAAVMGLVEQGPRQALPIAVGNLAMLLGFICVGRGLGLFIGRSAKPWTDAVPLGLVALISVIDLAIGLNPYARATVASACFAAVLARDLWLSARPVWAEFGVVAGVLIHGPMLFTALLFARRSVTSAWRYPAEAQMLLTAPTTMNTVALFALTTMATLFNLSLAYLVVMRLVRQLQHLSRHDSLTGLMNRRALLSALNAEQRRVRRGAPAWALLLVDIDHFKRVNDTHGHAVGDEVLCRVARALQQSAREVDLVARVGGEEFCVFAPMTPPHGAALLAERLRRGVETSAAETGGVAVTISIGVALAQPGVNETADMAMARADVALYRAKAAGRNRVEMPADDEPAPGVPAREPLAVP